MVTTYKRREIEYPVIEGADEKLKEVCLIGINERYSGNTKEKAEERLADELAIIRQQGSASGYLIVLDALKSVGYEPDDICVRGTNASALVSYVAGLSNIDPLGVVPYLYPEFYYGIDGNRHPSFEVNVEPDFLQRIIQHYDNYSGKEHLKHIYDDDDHILGVFIGDFDESEITSPFCIGVFRILFIEAGNMRRAVSDFVSKEILDVCSPKTFADYVKCCGLEHGTGVWEGNAKTLIKDGKVSTDKVIADREDVFELLIEHGIDKRAAFDIAEKTRKGRICRAGWNLDTLELLHSHEVPEWFIDSCRKIEYLFPRAHAMVYLKTYCNITP